MKLFFAVIAALVCGSEVARAELISTFIGLTSLIASIGVSTAVAGAIGGVIVGGVLSVGLNYASSLLRGSAGSGQLTAQSQTATQQEATLSTRQSAPSKRIPYGIVHAGGALCFEECKAPYFVRTYMISAEEIDGLEAIYLGTEKIAFSSFAPSTILTPIAVDGQPNYPGRLRVCFQVGKTTQGPCPLLLNRFPNLGSTFAQEGIATVTVECHYGTDDAEHQLLWGLSGDPEFLFVMRGIKIYDPRDPTQSRDDKSTWKFSRTAVLGQNDYLRRDFGGRISADKIPFDLVAIDADYDDGLIHCLDGTFIKRYTLDGMVTMNQPPADTITQMGTANRGSVVQTSGTVRHTSSRPLISVATIYDAILAGGISYQNDKSKRDQINTVQTRFISPDREYNLTDGPIFSYPDEITADGEKLVATLSLPFTNDHRIGQRLAKAFHDTARLGKTISVPVDIRVLAEATDQLPNNPVTFESDLFPSLNGIYKAGQVTLGDAYATVNLDVTQYSAAIENDWIDSRDEKSFTVADINVS